MKKFLQKIDLKRSVLAPGILLFTILFFAYFIYNAQTNMDTRGSEFGFHFLRQESSFDVNFSVIE